MRRLFRLLPALFLASCESGAPVPHPVPPAAQGPACQALLRASLSEVAELRAQGRLELARRRAVAAETVCPPLLASVQAAELALLLDLGDDEAAQVLARAIVESDTTTARVAAQARAALARPARPKTRADLRIADELRAKGDLTSARDAYEKALAGHPRDPLALAALGELELARSNGPAARRLFDRAFAGSHVRVVAFEPLWQRGPVVSGTLLPDALEIGMLHRVTPSGGRFRSAIVGPSVAAGPNHLVTFGAGLPLFLSSRDGRDPRALALAPHDVTAAAFVPGAEDRIVALAQGAVHLIDAAGGAVLARRDGIAGRLAFAGPTRLVVGTDVLRIPELTSVYSLPADATLNPKVVAFTEVRNTKRGQRTMVVVKRAEDGAAIFERDIGEVDSDPVVGIHPSGRFVGFLGEVYVGENNHGGILDVETKKVTLFPYQAYSKQFTSALRIAKDGRSVCIFDYQWSPSPPIRGKMTLCWVRSGEAVIVSVTPTPKFRVAPGGSTPGSLSPDGKLAAFAEVKEDAAGSGVMVVRVIDVETGGDVRRLEIGTIERFAVDADMVSNTVVRVYSGDAIARYYDVRTGAPVPSPSDMREPELGVLPEAPFSEKLLKRGEAKLWLMGGFLKIASEATETCWYADLCEAPLDRCGPTKANDVLVRAGVAFINGRPHPIKLALPIPKAYGFVAKTGNGEIIVISHNWMARYFSITGEFLGTLVALGPKRLAGFTADGRVELFGERSEGGDPLACVVDSLVFSLEACADRSVVSGAFLGNRRR